MENFMTYIIIAAVVFNVVSNYIKEVKKNKDRALNSQQSGSTTNQASTDTPTSKKVTDQVMTDIRKFGTRVLFAIGAVVDIILKALNAQKELKELEKLRELRENSETPFKPLLNRARPATNQPSQSATPPPFSRRVHTLENNTQPNNKPVIESIESIDTIPTFTPIVSTILDNANFGEEGKSAIQAQIDNNREDEIRRGLNSDIEERTEFDLKLETQDDMKRALIHSLIFDRKY
ncbi:MAG: hypothetical protein RL662_501 [Bacteroidota bacterium]|jgi:hypothetical protein